MQCPVCSGVSLVMTERQGVEIDYCPKCRGVWLDRGELDKIIERSGQMMENESLPVARPESNFPPRDPRRDDAYDRDDRYRDRDDRYHDDKDYYKRKKRKSFWSEIFDFD